MKISFLVTVFMLTAAAGACAQQSPSIPTAKDRHPVTTRNSELSPVYSSGKCRFRTKLVAGEGYSPAAGDSYMFHNAKPTSWGFPIHCYFGASQNKINEELSIMKRNGQWMWLPAQQPFEAKQHFKLIRFHGKNWHGTATAIDQIYYAPPEHRSRFFNFCLVENDGPQVLCGRTQIRGVTQPKSESRLPKIMAVLKTIVFVDSPKSPAPPSTSSHDH